MLELILIVIVGFWLFLGLAAFVQDVGFRIHDSLQERKRKQRAEALKRQKPAPHYRADIH